MRLRLRNFMAVANVLLVLALSGTGCEGNKMKATDAFTDPKTIALVMAAQKGDVEGVHTAVRSGADPNARGKDDATPLLVVLATTINKAGLAALLSAGADPSLPATRGVAPLTLVVRAKDPELLQIMLKGGANPNWQGSTGEPLIWLAARDDRWDNVDTLLKSGADINALDGSGYTTVMRVASLQQYDRVMWLIARGANVTHVTRIGVSLAEFIESDNTSPNSPQYAWKQKVIAALQSQGIKVQVPPAQN
jgi:ankyrin repeat protein